MVNRAVPLSYVRVSKERVHVGVNNILFKYKYIKCALCSGLWCDVVKGAVTLC